MTTAREKHSDLLHRLDTVYVGFMLCFNGSISCFTSREKELHDENSPPLGLIGTWGKILNRTSLKVLHILQKQALAKGGS